MNPPIPEQAPEHQKESRLQNWSSSLAFNGSPHGYCPIFIIFTFFLWNDFSYQFLYLAFPVTVHDDQWGKWHHASSNSGQMSAQLRNPDWRVRERLPVNGRMSPIFQACFTVSPAPTNLAPSYAISTNGPDEAWGQDLLFSCYTSFQHCSGTNAAPRFPRLFGIVPWLPKNAVFDSVREYGSIPASHRPILQIHLFIHHFITEEVVIIYFCFTSTFQQ